MQHSCSHSNAICNHSFKKRIELRTQKQPAATTAHTRYLSSPAAATLHGKTQGFVLRLPPQNIAHATFMQPFQCDLQPQLQETNRTTHTGTTTRCKTHRRNHNDRSRNRRTHEVPLIAGRDLTRKNARFHTPASSPTQAPCNINAGQFFCDVLLYVV